MINKLNDFEMTLDVLEGAIRSDSNVDINEDADIEMFKELAKVEGLKDYLVRTMAKDYVRYFNADKEYQDITAGGFHRTKYLYKKLIEHSELA